MPSEFRSPRTLPSWFELDYFTRRTLFRRWWRVSLLLAAVGALLGLGLMLLAAGRRTFQAGPLSTPHALFNDRCELCHENTFATVSRMWRGDGVGSVTNDRCLACHAGSHHNEHAAMGRCVSCHREHRGHAALVRLDDRRCVECHRDLKWQDGHQSRVTAFAAGHHPEFSTPRDPDAVRFNHHYHLVDLEQYRQALMAKAKGDDGARRRLRSLGTEPLTCASCHQEDAAGRYMRPISYHDHCQRCHPLSVSVQGAWKDRELTAAAVRFNEQPLRHPRTGETAAVVRADLRERLAAFLQGPLGKGFLNVPPPEQSRRLPWPSSDAPRAEKEFAWVAAHLQQTERALYTGAGGCLLCHVEKNHAEAPRDGLPLLIDPVIPTRWHRQATFKHVSHRMMTCEGCHDARASQKTSDVLLPKMDTCLKCHHKGAARSDCVECHVYHDPALQQKAREKGTWMIDEILRGGN